MNIQLKYVLLLVTFAMAEKQIKLEDIERDNLLSERRVNREQSIFNIGQSQRLSAPIRASSEKSDNDLGEDIVYAQPSAAADSAEQYGKPEQKTSIQYVTPQQQDYEAKPTTVSFVHPVHEATHTYSSPARESLVNPIVFKPAASQSPYLSQQPKFVYVQAGPQQLTQSGVVTYGQPQHSAENVVQTQQKNAQDDISYPAIEQNQIAESSQQAVHAPSRQENYASRALQYFPYLTQTPSLPNYVMLFRNPTHTQAYAIPSIQYAQPASIQYAADQTAPTQHLTAPQQQSEIHLGNAQPTLAATFVNPTIDGTAILPAPESTAIPSATLQYATIPQLQLAPQPLHLHPVAPQSLHLQPEFIAPPQVPNPHQYYSSSSHLPSPVDIYHSLQKHHPSSLLDSYIPSSLVWAQRQRALINRQLLHAVSGNFASPTLTHPTQFFQHGSHQPGYNTIAYSTAQGYSKRSPKLVTERPLKLKPRN
ncbi:uncharacterized protein LOC129575826 isoform X2 [Sitodiplosis mosellana]|uniref:uncharacterized protein LOC129575826 isoform X2 n=1 Tax=Sitodiplosis mosellana TaxID=263140 RepID=UPI0024439DB2|nr:uncharacterized protein LOC129575826 isoform X2 [Sitodiplosis mosellana]